jgi:hypothetical protein
MNETRTETSPQVPYRNCPSRPHRSYSVVRPEAARGEECLIARHAHALTQLENDPTEVLNPGESRHQALFNEAGKVGLHDCAAIDSNRRMESSRSGSVKAATTA